MLRLGLLEYVLTLRIHKKKLCHRPRHAQNASGSNPVQTIELPPDRIGTKKFRTIPPTWKRCIIFTRKGRKYIFVATNDNYTYLFHSFNGIKSGSAVLKAFRSRDDPSCLASKFAAKIGGRRQRRDRKRKMPCCRGERYTAKILAHPIDKRLSPIIGLIIYRGFLIR